MIREGRKSTREGRVQRRRDNKGKGGREGKRRHLTIYNVRRKSTCEGKRDKDDVVKREGRVHGKKDN